jgi:hypothetical protein
MEFCEKELCKMHKQTDTIYFAVSFKSGVTNHSTGYLLTKIQIGKILKACSMEEKRNLPKRRKKNMDCPTCGLEQPAGIPHKDLDYCQVALVAAQDAVRLTIIQMIDEQNQRSAKNRPLDDSRKGGDKHGNSSNTL